MNNDVINRRRALEYGLVGEHKELYEKSPEFRQAIDGLSYLLPPMIQGLADQAKELLDRRHDMLQELIKTPIFPMASDLVSLGIEVHEDILDQMCEENHLDLQETRVRMDAAHREGRSLIFYPSIREFKWQ